jgi:thiamine-phosphate pyrophosphorylase
MARISPRVVQVTAMMTVPRDELLARIARARLGYAILLRDPELDGRELFEWGSVLRGATRAVGAALLVDDRIDVALAIEADGLHLGRRSPPLAEARRLMGTAFISCSAHDVEDARRAAEQGADSVLLSPIFATPDKGTPVGLEVLAQTRALLPKRTSVIALGGITRDTAHGCFVAGADGVASIRADLSELS